MKKALSVLMLVAFLFSCMCIPAFAEDVAAGETIEENTVEIGTNNGTIEVNDTDGFVETNCGEIGTNNGTVNLNDTDGSVSVNNGMIYASKGEVTDNEYKVVYMYPSGSITENHGTVLTTDGTIQLNAEDGSIDTNKWIVTGNSGEVTINKRTVTTNNETGTIGKNEGTVKSNNGTVTDNSGTIGNNFSSGTVTANDGEISNNFGSVEDNSGTIGNNFSSGSVTTNEGTVAINQGDIETNAAGGTVTKNYGTVTDNYGTVNNEKGGTVTDNYGTVNNEKGGSVTNNYGTEIGTGGETIYGIVVNNSDAQGHSALVQFIQGISQDLKELFSRDNYELKGYEEGEEQSENTEYTAQKPGTIRLIWEKIGGDNNSGGYNSHGNVTGDNGNDSTEPLSYSNNITYILGDKEAVSTGIKPNGETVKVWFKENALREGRDFVVDGGVIIFKAEFLETLKAGTYTFCIEINGVQTWILLTVS